MGTGVQVRNRSGQVATRDELRAELNAFAPSYQNLLPRGYEPDRLITGAMLAVSKSPELAQCKPITIAMSLGQVAQWGLDIGTTAHLVPFNVKVSKRGEPDRWEKHCTAIADYKGLIELMVAAGAKKVEAHEVREGDLFEFAYGTEPYLRHTPVSSSTKIIGVYGVVFLRQQVVQFEYMRLEEIEAIRQKSKSWATGDLPSWYARKTVIRRLAKYVPKTPRLAALLNQDENDLAPLPDDQGAAMMTPGSEAGDAREPTDEELDQEIAGREGYSA